MWNFWRKLYCFVNGIIGDVVPSAHPLTDDHKYWWAGYKIYRKITKSKEGQ